MQNVSCGHSFEEKGIITAALHENESINMEFAEEIAIEADAEEVTQQVDDDFREIYRVSTLNGFGCD